MKIAYCIGALNLGGIGTVAKNLADYYSKKNVVFNIITTHHKGNFFEEAKNMGWPVLDVSNNESSLKTRIQNIYKILLEYDVLINNHSDEARFALPMLSPKLVKLSVQHNTTKKSSISLGWNASYLNYWAGVSPAVIKAAKTQFPQFPRFEILPNGVVGITKNVFNFKTDIIRIAFLGRLNQKPKNIFLIPSIITELQKSKFNIEFHIAGDGDNERKLIKLLGKKVQSGIVKFHGRIRSSEVEELFTNCDFLLNPSFWEGLPMVVLESMSCGLLPILSPIEPHQYAVGEFRKLIVYKNETNYYVERILYFRNNPKEYEFYRNSIIKRWKNHFSIDAMGGNYDKLIQKAIQNPMKYKSVKLSNLKIPFKDSFKLTKVYNWFQKIHRFSK